MTSDDPGPTSRPPGGHAPGIAARGRRGLVALLVVYLALVARVTLWPQPAPDDVFDVVHEVADWLADHHVRIAYDLIEATSNVVMFVPFGVLVGLLVRRRWVVIALGCGLSLAIETLQGLFLPTRVADPRDVVMNTLGAAIGVLLVPAARRAVASLSTRLRPRTSP